MFYTTGLVRKTEINKKIPEIENKIPSITRLFTIAVVNAKVTDIENIIPDTGGLAWKTNYDAKLRKLCTKHYLKIT